MTDWMLLSVFTVFSVFTQNEQFHTRYSGCGDPTHVQQYLYDNHDAVLISEWPNKVGLQIARERGKLMEFIGSVGQTKDGTRMCFRLTER